MELPSLFPDLEGGPAKRSAPPRPRMTKEERLQRQREKERKDERDRALLRKLGQPTKQNKLRIRWRTSSAPIKRRVHEVAGNDEFAQTPTQELEKLLIGAFEDAIFTLNNPEAPPLEVAEVAAWIDAAGTGATGAATAAELFVRNLYEATREQIDSEIVLERLSRKVPQLSLQSDPKAFAIYLAAYLCG